MNVELTGRYSNSLAKTTNTYVLGIGDRLQSVTSASSADRSFSYDLAGNTSRITTGTNVLSLGWNEKYQLTSVTSSVSKVNYTYDVLGRRASRIVAEGLDLDLTTVEQYLYDGPHVVADLDASGNTLRTYTWGPGIDNLLGLTVWSGESASAPAATYYPLKDHQNSIVALVNASGTLVESYEYDAYGNPTVYAANNSKLETSQLGNRYLFQGREYDSTTGLYYFRARWYSAETGRWLSKDPIGISGGLNLYVFCGNNPVNLTDPLGLWQVTIYGGRGLGGYLSFGYNGFNSGSGQWNLSLRVGAGVGLSAGIDMTDSGYKSKGFTPITLAGSIGAGLVGAAGEVGQNPDGSMQGSVAARVVLVCVGGAVTAPQNGQATCSQSAGYGNWGASGFLGTGWTW